LRALAFASFVRDEMVVPGASGRDARYMWRFAL
jgi:hypothetical protein